MDMKSQHIHAFRYGGEEFGAKATLSLGCAVSDDGDDVIKRADDNLYRSKKNGKNQVTS